MGEDVLVKDGQVVSMAYRLTVGGQVLDESAEGQPLQFIQGQGMIIPGLERELYGMAVGESKDVLVAPRDGYGEQDPSALVEVERGVFPPDMSLVAGQSVQMRNQNGQIFNARILEIAEQSVRLDFNHPLAGQELSFAIQILGLRDASSEELAHRHIH